jgi:hypothetical protein
MNEKKTSRPGRVNRLAAAVAMAACGAANAQVFTWSTGTYLAAGLPNPLPASAVVNVVSGGTKSFASSVQNDGVFNWNTTDSVFFEGNGTTLRNNGLFTFATDNWIRPFASDNTLDNAGVLRKAGGSGDLLVDTLLVNRAGATLDAQSGTIRYRNAGTLEAGSLFTGNGRHVFDTIATYNFQGPFSGPTDNVVFSRGDVRNTGAERLAPDTTLTWAGGRLLGDWRVASGRTLTTANGFDKTLVGSLVIDGTLAWNATNTPFLSDAGTSIRNNGLFTFATDNWIRPFGSDNTLDNAGVLRKAGGSGDLLVDTLLVNRAGATLDAQSGTIRYRNAGTLEAGSLFTGNGRHVFDTIATYNFQGPFSGPTDNVVFSRGDFRNTGAERLAPDTTLTWAGGRLLGDWRVASGRTFTTANGFDKTLVGSLVVDGTLAWNATDSPFLSDAGTSIRNNGLFTFATDNWIRPFGSNNTLDNAGILRKAGGSGELRIDTLLVNTGAIESLSGTIRLPSDWRNEGTLRGTAGYASSRVTNAGDIAPGLPEGPNRIATLSFAGALVNDAAGSFSFDVGGAGVSDRIAVSGSVGFDGAVRVIRFDDYRPTVGDTFRVMTFGGFTGALDDVIEVGFGSGVVFSALYSGDALDLRVTAVPEPGTYALMLLGIATMLVWRRGQVAGAAGGCR